MMESLELKMILCVMYAVLNSGVTHVALTGPAASYAGAEAVFTCSGGDTVNVQWLVNGTLLNSSHMNNIVSEFRQIIRVGNLLLRDVQLQYNGTIIQCRANTSSGSIIYSNIMTLLVQGILSAVGDLSATALDSTISLTWNPPFTLDITGVDPDITYRVDVINSTSSQVIHSQGGINVTQYNYTTSLSPERRACDVFKFTITPVNIVGNGSESSISKGFLNVVPFVLSHDASLINGWFSFHIRMSVMVCRVNVVGISIWNYDDEEISVRNMIATINASDRTIIQITSFYLILNRHYNVTFNVSNSAGANTLNLMLSTHDVQCTDIENSTVNISCVENTKAKGALCILISVHDGCVDFYSSVFIFIQRNEEHTMPLYLRPGKYNVLFYDVESNGRLLSGVGYPAYIQKINVTQTGSVPVPRSPHLENCDVSHSNGNILASCEFPSTLMASGFQIILQFNDPTNVESVRRLMVDQTLDRNTSVSINVSRSGTYYATIFAILNMTILDEFPSYSKECLVNIQDGTETFSPITGNNTMPNDSLIAVGVGIGVTVLVVIGIVLCGTTTLLFHKKCKSNRNPSSEKKSQNVEFQLDPTVISSSSRVMYEDIADPPSAFNCTQCPAYETTTEVDKHEYEDVKLYGNLDIPTTQEAYQLTPCSAYGVPVHSTSN